jgi:two-component system, LuxR family, sensor histidine kinase DctS
MQGVVTYVNPAFCDLVGYGSPELLGRAPPMPYWPPEAREEYGKRLTTRLAGQIEREAFEAEFVRKDGERVAVWVFEAPLKDARGQQTGWMACVLDVTEKNRSEELSRTAQERLAASARLASMGEVASTLAHELNQPLAAIAGFVGGARNLLAAAPAVDATGDLQADLEYALSQAQTQAQRAGQVIKSVSDFVRRRVPVREPVAISDVLQAIDPLIALAAKKHRVLVRQHLPADLPAVVIDKVMFEQMLLNLARNGIEAMSSGNAHNQATRRELIVTAEHDCEAHVLRLHVQDYGGGMDSAIAAQLFTPFFTTKKEGMGMGLAICRSVAESHGGRLTFETTAGDGTTFTVTLPV